MKSCVFYVFEEEGRKMAEKIERKANTLANGKPWEVTAMARTVYEPIHNKVGVLVSIKISPIKTS